MFLTNTSLVIGRGELYFGKFIPGTFESDGEVYVGNTPGFSITRSLEEVERSTSYGGQKIPLSPYSVREENRANVVTDNIGVDNLALWFGAEVDGRGQDPSAEVSESFVVKRGRHYQLGKSVSPVGVRHVADTIIFLKDGDEITAAGNFELHLDDGRFYVLPKAAQVNDGQTITVVYQWRASPSKLIAPSPKAIVGSLRFISKNPVGPRTDYFFPFVRMKPQGQIDLKGDQFQQAMFSVDILKLNAFTAYFYANEISGASFSDDESSIIEIGPIPLEMFPALEDILHRSVNIGWPNALTEMPFFNFLQFESDFNELTNSTLPAHY